MLYPRFKLFLILLFFIPSTVVSQCDRTTTLPSKCVVIESILVDACSNPEGANEMMKIRIGKDPINISDITISWPNNPWRGFANEAATTPLISQLNNEITSCGRILYPSGNILPAGAEVLIICSQDYQMGSHSFAGLVDTIYALFQNPGNTNGHFANYVSSGSVLRTTTINVSGANGCSDMATYDRSKLVMQNGNQGGQDGGTVLFFENKNPEYINVGCAPPLEDFDFEINANKLLACPSDTINLSAILKGKACVKWNSELGVFSDEETLNTFLYLPDNISLDSFKIYGTAKTLSCSDDIVDSITIKILQKPNISFTMPDSVNVCGLNAIDLTVNSSVNNPVYSWQYLNQSILQSSPFTLNIPSANLPFYVSASISNSCGNSIDSIYLYSESSIHVFAGKDTAICQNQVLSLNGIGNGINPTWFTNGNGSFANPNVYATTYTPASNDVGEIKIYFSDESNCDSQTDSLILTMDALPNPNFICDTNICENQNAVLLIPVEMGGVFSGIGVNGNTFNHNGAGLYSVLHKIQNGACEDSFQQNILVQNAPIADFFQTPSDNITLNTMVDFFNNSTGAHQFEWLIESVVSYTENSRYFFDSKGFKSVRLVVFDSLTGCSDTLQKEIEVKEDVHFYVGNCFTPNGDSLNDRFIVVASGYSEINMFIYNRWGELLFKSNDATVRGWDGTYMGKECADGVYIYIIEMKDRDNKAYRFNGTLQLIR